VVALLKERAATIVQLADAAVLFYRRLRPTDALKAQHYSAEARPALQALHARLKEVQWSRGAIGGAVKEVVSAHGLKMPKVAMPLRVMVTGEPQTPSIDATLELIGREEVLRRMGEELATFPK
jgi:glutamyl-tRNA synthetase